MLVISRRVGERVKIGPDVWVMVTKADDGCARIAIDAPRNLKIVREELLVKAKAAFAGQVPPAAAVDDRKVTA